VTVVDTHAWLWWVAEPARLGKAARRALNDARRVGVPAICCLEVAALAARGRVTLDRPPLAWLQDALGLPRVELVPLTPAVAVKAAGLPASFPGDPADRLVVATALIEAGVLVTKDSRIQDSSLVETVWA
jgi:PIN domain nuclease of toxin-antitoxin system